MEAPANLVIPVLLFILLSPGMLFVLPIADPAGAIGLVPIPLVLAHAAVFGAIYLALRTTFPQYY